MTDTYFIRHSSALDVDKQTISMLWQENRIAIHYPHDESGTFHLRDSRSLDPRDYSGRGRAALARLIKLARHGGYVFATYRGMPGGKIGYVSAGSVPALVYGRWERAFKPEEREAVLKSLVLDQVRNLSAVEAVSFTTVQPRQGTFCKWHRVGQRVRELTIGSPVIGLGRLSPDLQEVMCMEYLRTSAAQAAGLPVLLHTLMPVGRTMKDVDIFGMTDLGTMISAQVTFKRLHDAGAKLRKLGPYRAQGNHTILFCDCDARMEIDGHLIVPLKDVFEHFCLESAAGKHWFNLATSTI